MPHRVDPLTSTSSRLTDQIPSVGASLRYERQFDIAPRQKPIFYMRPTFTQRRTHGMCSTLDQSSQNLFSSQLTSSGTEEIDFLNFELTGWREMIRAE